MIYLTFFSLSVALSLTIHPVSAEFRCCRLQRRAFLAICARFCYNAAMKKCLILVNAYSQLKSSLNQSERLAEELKKLGVEAEIKRNDFFACYVSEGGFLRSCAGEYDFCIYLDKDKYISAMLEKSGLRLFNSHTSIQLCDDKMLTSIALADSGVPLPETLAGLLCYDAQSDVSETALRAVEKKLGYPLIVKASYGSLGSGVFKADDFSSLLAIARELKCTPHLFQRFVSESAGRDIRVIVVGGEVVAAMLRSSETDFRSNIELGGVGTPVEVDRELGKLCIRTAEALGLDYYGIDVLLGEGGYLVCEVNSNAFFGGIERVTGINVAGAYAKYIYDKIYKEQ